MRKVPENNSLKKEIEEIVKLCEKAIPEYGENASFFNEGASEEDMKQWEETNEKLGALLQVLETKEK